MSCIAEQTFTKAFQTSTFSQNFDIKEPGLSRVVSENCISKQFCGGHYPAYTKPNQACQIGAAGFPVSAKAQCVGFTSLPLRSAASFPCALSGVITTGSTQRKPCMLLCGATWGILISNRAEKHSCKLKWVYTVDRGGWVFTRLKQPTMDTFVLQILLSRCQERQALVNVHFTTRVYSLSMIMIVPPRTACETVIVC